MKCQGVGPHQKKQLELFGMPQKGCLQVSGTLTAWLVHWVVIKLVLYLLGIPSAVPFLENLALAGYPFVYACMGVGLTLLVGGDQNSSTLPMPGPQVLCC